MFILARYLRLSHIAASFAGITFMLSGYLLSILSFSTTLSSVCWLPFVVLFFLKSIDSTDLKSWLFFTVCLGIMLGIQFLGGEPAIIYGSVLFITGYAVMEVFHHRTMRVRVLLCVPIACIIMIFLTAVQLIPFIEFIFHSDRKFFSYETQTMWSLKPQNLLSLFVPFITGDITKINVKWYELHQLWLISIYSGILPLILAPFALIVKDRRIRYFFFVALFFILLTFGGSTPVYKFCFYALPAFKMIRYPVKFFFIPIFCLALLSGYGLSILMEKRRTSVKVNFKPFLFIPLLVFLALGYIILFNENIFIDKVFSSLFEKDVYCRYNAVRSFLLQSVFFSAAGLILLVGFIYKKINKIIFSILVFLLLVVDLFISGFNINKPISNEFYETVPENAKFLKKNLKEDERIFTFFNFKEANYLYGKTFDEAHFNALASLRPDFGLIYGLDYADGYESMFVDRYVYFSYLNLTQRRLRYLSLFNARYIITFSRIADSGSSYLTLEREDQVRIYKYNKVLPRVFFHSDILFSGNVEESFEMVKAYSFDPFKQAVIEADKTGRAKFTKIMGLNNNKKNDIKIVKRGLNELFIKADIYTSPGFLIIADAFYPGWKAVVDKKPTKIFPANLYFRGIFLDKGKHDIKLKFDPVSFKIGLIISCISIIILIIFFIKSKNYIKNN